MKKRNYSFIPEMTERVNISSCSVFCLEIQNLSLINATDGYNTLKNGQGEVNIPYVNEWTIILKK